MKLCVEEGMEDAMSVCACDYVCVCVHIERSDAKRSEEERTPKKEIDSIT